MNLISKEWVMRWLVLHIVRVRVDQDEPTLDKLSEKVMLQAFWYRLASMDVNLMDISQMLTELLTNFHDHLA